MDCKKIEKIILTDYADGLLEGEALKEVETHIASCPQCRRLASELTSIGATFRKAERLEAPPGVWERIRADITERRAGHVTANDLVLTARFLFGRLRPALVVATAAVLILVAITATRLIPQKVTIFQDDIISMVASEENGNGAEYDFGTAVENYFL